MITGLFLLAALQSQDSAATYHHEAAPELRARRTRRAIQVDGILDERDWARAVPATAFTQLDPQEGEPASERTEVRVLIGEDALYIGARLFDREPGRIISRLTRRDASLSGGDAFQVFIDSYHDHLTAYGFGITPAGAIRDVVIGADGEEDDSWDPVWDAAAKIDSLGWTAELRIPLSQLRYRRQHDAVWGIQLSRRILRKQEASFFAFTPKAEREGVNRYGHLVGLGQIETSERFELLPHTVLQAEYRPAEPGDPFRDGSAYVGDVGFELKYKVSSGLTLNATVNPDFGQVEADPAEVNLTDFETRFDEKRPFFVEGEDLFRFGRLRAGNTETPPEFFFSRRIGREPSLEPDYDWVDMPDATTILGAAKLSGKTAGWSIGVLDAVTAKERGRFLDEDGRFGSTPVEPRANYFAARATRELREGNTTVGALVTAVNRDLPNEDLAAELRSSAYAVGVDVNHAWGNRTWALDFSLAGSTIGGTAEVIDDVQRSSARYFQRPDATHVDYDPTRTSLSGHALQLAFSKKAGHHWRWSFAYQEVSPELEVNDLGFQRRADRRVFSGELQYRQQQPTRLVRWWLVSGSASQQWNFGGDRVETELTGYFSTQLRNYWSLDGYLSYDLPSLNPRLTRGGPLGRDPGNLSTGLSVSSDDRKPVLLWTDFFYYRDRAGAWNTATTLSLSAKPSSGVKLSVGPYLEWGHFTAQYVTRTSDTLATATFGRRYVFSNLDQTTLSLKTRLDWTFSPQVSLQVYGQIFVSSADFYEFKEFVAPRTFEFSRYGKDRGTIARDSSGAHSVDPDGLGPAASFVIYDPNFNQRALRTTTVLRWEYRPGSTLFFAWQHRRFDQEAVGDFSLGRDLGGLFGAEARNVFVLKVSYWLGL